MRIVPLFSPILASSSKLFVCGDGGGRWAHPEHTFEGKNDVGKEIKKPCRMVCFLSHSFVEQQMMLWSGPRGQGGGAGCQTFKLAKVTGVLNSRPLRRPDDPAYIELRESIRTNWSDSFRWVINVDVDGYCVLFSSLASPPPPPPTHAHWHGFSVEE